MKTLLANTFYVNIIQEPFNLSEKIDGSPIRYKIIYIAISSQLICETIDIPSASYNGDFFSHTFEVLSSNCLSNDIAVTVFATNVLGDGPSSFSVIGLHNRFLAFMS